MVLIEAHFLLINTTKMGAVFDAAPRESLGIFAFLALIVIPFKEFLLVFRLAVKLVYSYKQLLGKLISLVLLN